MDKQLENEGIGTMDKKSQTTMDSHEDYEKSFRNISRGDYLTGKVVKIEDDGVYVDIGWKREGFIPLNQLTHKTSTKTEDEVQLGEEVPVIVLKVDDMEGELILSKKRADLEAAWHRVTKAFENSEVIPATAVEAVKGGLLVDLGLRGFVPASQVDIRPVRDLEEYVGDVLSLKVIELDQARRKVVLSRKKVLEEEKVSSKERIFGTLYEGQIVKGKVARLTNFGAFINLGGVDGLVHISEMAWKRIKHPNEVVNVGDSIDVMVLKVDSDRERISLSRRQALPDPWAIASETISIGNLVKGKISKVAKKYVFVEVIDGVEGVIPLNELTDEKMVNPEQFFREGQEIEVKVLAMQWEARRMMLSLKQASGEGSRSEVANYMSSGDSGSAASIGDILKAKMDEEQTKESPAVVEKLKSEAPVKVEEVKAKEEVKEEAKKEESKKEKAKVEEAEKEEVKVEEAKVEEIEIEEIKIEEIPVEEVKTEEPKVEEVKKEEEPKASEETVEIPEIDEVAEIPERLDLKDVQEEDEIPAIPDTPDLPERLEISDIEDEGEVPVISGIPLDSLDSGEPETVEVTEEDDDEDLFIEDDK
jgi:small subunit ribosomal protein S1